VTGALTLDGANIVLAGEGNESRMKAMEVMTEEKTEGWRRGMRDVTVEEYAGPRMLPFLSSAKVRGPAFELKFC
jgi:hypothetical protein